MNDQQRRDRASNRAAICDVKNHLDYVSYKIGNRQPEQSSRHEEEQLRCMIENRRWNTIQSQLSDMCLVARQFATSNHQRQLWKDFFMFHSIDIEKFSYDLNIWLSMSDFKRNTLFFKGPTNSGKSLLVNCIIEPFVPAFISGINKNQSEFVFMPALTSNMVVLEELFLTIDTVNDFKRLMEGGYMTVHMKYHSPQVLRRRPVIATSQYSTVGHGYLPTDDEVAISNRTFEYRFRPGFNTTEKLTSTSFWSFIVSYWNAQEKKYGRSRPTATVAIC